MSDSMLKERHKLLAEESIDKFITYLEETSGRKVEREDQKWLFEKGIEFFESYYVDDQFEVSISSEEDRERLSEYFKKIQETLSRMFAHIMLLEFKLRLLDRSDI